MNVSVHPHMQEAREGSKMNQNGGMGWYLAFNF